ncbi:T9SS type A sorting domain-containing protein [Chryseobacterium polytrichastri]|uniref:Por secretion system C-terminal sorting domain-containing protein n=1 Tax=Chryseobacterium polytrichastri TaxID=1302687 RepID=A0A1M7EA10_9FLAO|nr:T9SS type A sorting domain-containing protein [Chryseobacterium polytrichastri]SHL88567.1 Por secretion system C-terminal sorting domain-containing protein [Chryseobacterium polytrichastri]
MKKTVLTLFFILFLQISFAQVSFAGNPEYGQLRNFVYDKTVSNKIYATTYIDKHIMVSTDNGTTWNILYTLAYPAYAPNISQMKLTNNGTALSFIQYFGAGSSFNKVIVLDLQSLNIIKEFNIPTNEAIASISNYSILDNGNMNTASLLTKGDNDKFFTTTNGGSSWTKVYDATNHENVILNDAIMDPVDAQKLYIVRNGGPGNVDGGLLKSTDAGATWTETLNGLILQSIAINPSNPNIIYAGTGILWAYPTQHEAVYKSTDGGNTWAEQTGITWSTNTQGLKNVPKIEINPYDPNHVIILADDRVAVTVNDGSTWTTTPHNGIADGSSYFYGINAAFNPKNLNNVLISSNRFPKLSSDKGVTLTSIANPFFRGMGKINTIDDNGTDKLIYGVQYGYTVKNLVNNLETPINVMPLSESPMSGEIGLIYVDRKKAGRVYTYESSFMGNNINVSDDYGTNVTQLYNTYDTGFTAAETDPTNSNIAWIATFNGVNATLIKSDFTNIGNPTNDIITLPYDEDYIYGIKVNQNNANEVLVTVGNKLFKTTNSGTSWTEITAGLQGLVLPNIALSLVQNPLNTNQYTMAASNGIYTSLDSGNTWSKIYDGMVNKVEHSTKQNGQIIGITNTYLDTLPKVIYTNNGGANWQERTASNYFNTTVLDGTARFVDTNTAEVYLTTNSLGIIKDVINFSTLGTSNPGIVKDDISIYPNPAQDVINIKLGKNATKFKVTIYSTVGQLVLTSENKSSIDISNLTKGVYLLKIEQLNSPTIIKKVIKK